MGQFIYVNGEIVRREHALISVFDRGFLYGDGLFETVAIRDGAPRLWKYHVERLQSGAARLCELADAPVPVRLRTAHKCRTPGYGACWRDFS